MSVHSSTRRVDAVDGHAIMNRQSGQTSISQLHLIDRYRLLNFRYYAQINYQSLLREIIRAVAKRCNADANPQLWPEAKEN